MKDWIKLIIACIIAVGLGCLPAWGAYSLWAWAMAQVPATLAYAGLIKLGVSLLLFVAGFGITIWLTILAFALGCAIAAAILSI